MVAVKSLKLSKKGDSYRIRDVVPGHPLSDRLLELGLQTGEIVEVIHEAPLSRDPIVISICGTRLALRREEAGLVLVDELTSTAGSTP